MVRRARGSGASTPEALLLRRRRLSVVSRRRFGTINRMVHALGITHRKIDAAVVDDCEIEG